MNSIFLSLEDSHSSGGNVVGGKGWNLSRLQRYGFQVPRGGILTASAYEDFLKENLLRDEMEKIRSEATLGNIGTAEVRLLLEKTRKRITSGAIPSHIRNELRSRLEASGLISKPLSVRSSASAEDSGSASFAGIHESFLNVSGFDAVLAAIKGCYASLWTDRAVAYRSKMGIPDNEVLMAVVLMEMVHAQASGVAFSCDPRTGREDIITIGANFGLGESVVKGLVEPDEYILDSSFLEIKNKRIGAKENITIINPRGGTETITSELSKGQVLSDAHIKKLGNLVLRVLEAMGQGEMHQEIEWSFDGKSFILLQARPVTALPKVTFTELKDSPEIWSNANIRDAIPMVLPALNRSTVINNINNILNSPFKIIGYRLPEGLRQAKMFKGRAYLNLSAIQWYNFDALGIYPVDTNKNFGGHQPEIEIHEKNPYKGIKGLKRLLRMMKFFRAVAKYKKKANSHFAKVADSTALFLKKEVRALEDREFFPFFSEIIGLANEFAPVFMMMNGASASVSMLIKVADKSFPGQGASLVNALMAGNGNITSAQHGYRLVELAEIVRKDLEGREFFSSNYEPLLWEKRLPETSPFKREFRAFLDEFGHRGVYEMDISNPRWNEDPSYLLNVIRGMIETADFDKIRMKQREKTASAWHIINAHLPYHRRAFIRYLLKQSLKGVDLREMAKSVYTRILEPLRIMALEIGRRFEEKGVLQGQNDIFHCAWVEIFSILNGDWDGTGLALIVEERKYRFKELADLRPPDIIIDKTPHRSVNALRPGGDFMQGMAVAAGKASGPARLIHHPDEGISLNHGEVLVAPSTDPGWTPLFLRASAIIMETGGYFSHGSIVAREYGVPAVVNIPGIMNFLRDGQHVFVDGEEGKVFLEHYGEEKNINE